jgi:hypothetical protein
MRLRGQEGLEAMSMEYKSGRKEGGFFRNRRGCVARGVC